MPKVSIIILTKNRASLLLRALESVRSQVFSDYEIVVVNDGSSDNTGDLLASYKNGSAVLRVVTHKDSQGITASRQEALRFCRGEFVALLDDDDQWVDKYKLQKQVAYLDDHPATVLVGGGMKIVAPLESHSSPVVRIPPRDDYKIRATFLLKNNFYTSTVLFRKVAAEKVGGFMWNMYDVAEDYDLWLRLGSVGALFNFHEVFAQYARPHYSRLRFGQFLRKQLCLVKRHQNDYPHPWLARSVLKMRLFLL